MRKFIFFLTLLTIISCNEKKTIAFIENISFFTLDKNIFTNYVSISHNEGKITAIYSDLNTLSVKSSVTNLTDTLVSIIDKTGIDPISNPMFGKHSYLINDKTEYLVYCDFEKENMGSIKLLSKSLDSDKWNIIPQKIESYDFSCTFKDNDMYLFHYDGKINLSVLKDGIFRNLKILPGTTDVFDLKSVHTPGKINLFYLDQKNNLFYTEIKDNPRPLQIGKNIKFYEIPVIDGNLEVLYLATDKSLNLFDFKKNKSEKIGYFQELFAADMFSNGEKTYFVFSTAAENNGGSKYALSMAFKNAGGKWIEKKIAVVENPVNSVKSYNAGDFVYIACGGNEVKLILIEKKYLP